MEKAFWLERWRSGRTAFHEPEPNAHLVGQFDALGLPPGARVFVPLCGKSPDLGWLCAQGCDVVGVEFSDDAVAAAFDALGLAPEPERDGPLTRRRAGALTIYTGDVFALTAEQVGVVDLVYDRAALVALPPATRVRYAAHLADLAPDAAQFQITYEYDQTRMDGPPFAVLGYEIERLYGARYAIAETARRPIVEPLASRVSGDEVARMLTPRV